MDSLRVDAEGIKYSRICGTVNINDKLLAMYFMSSIQNGAVFSDLLR